MAGVLLDACLPAGLKRFLPDHEVVTAHQLGWGDLDDADLLRVMAGRFDILLTADKSIPYQQAEARANVAVVILRSRRIRLEDLTPAVPRILPILEEAEPGENYSIQIA